MIIEWFQHIFNCPLFCYNGEPEKSYIALLMDVTKWEMMLAKEKERRNDGIASITLE